MAKQNVYALNISGIAVGLAAVTLIYWQIAQIRDYDTQHPHADRLYRVAPPYAARSKRAEYGGAAVARSAARKPRHG